MTPAPAGMKAGPRASTPPCAAARRGGDQLRVARALRLRRRRFGASGPGTRHRHECRERDCATVRRDCDCNFCGTRYRDRARGDQLAVRGKPRYRARRLLLTVMSTVSRVIRRPALCAIDGRVASIVPRTNQIDSHNAELEEGSGCENVEETVHGHTAA